ncbi:hypothetical protein BGZ83_001543 [Gryganskiella cystojenkinii]|nr:hypothetical protein BGZ83_001543 [Gryganskiella cystojenkinii]
MGTAEALEQLRILSYCTELSRLYWTFAMRQGDDTEGSSFPRAEFLRLIRAQTWPLLRELRLKGVDFDDNEISQILDGLLQQREHNRDSCHNDDQRDTMTLSNNSSNNNNNRSSRGHLVYRSYQASSSMEKFSVSGHGFGFRAIHSLSQHFATLQWVDISGGANRTSHALQSILQSCPGLKGIEGDILRVSDMALGKPWVCLGLTYFGADIVVNSVEVNPSRERTPHHPGQILESEQQLKLGGSAHPTPTMTGHDFVYEQLSRLTILQDLNLHGMYKSLSSNEKDYDESHQRLRLDLDHGLNRLADLKRVQQLFFRRPQNMTMREMDWIQRHWCGLRQISWEMNGSDTAIQQDLADACRQWGVSPVRLS